jgi:hypothetical protein
LADTDAWANIITNLSLFAKERAKQRAKELAQVLAEDPRAMVMNQAVNQAVVALGELALSHCGDARNKRRVNRCVDDMVSLADMTGSTPQLGRLVVKTINRILDTLEDGRMVETLVPMLERIVEKLNSDE